MQDLSAVKEFLLSQPVAKKKSRDSRRMKIKDLVPEIRVLRSKGYNWEEIAALLKQQNIEMSKDTLRNYYTAFTQNIPHEQPVVHSKKAPTTPAVGRGKAAPAPSPSDPEQPPAASRKPNAVY